MHFVKRLVGLMTLLIILGASFTAAQGQALSGRTLIVGTTEAPRLQ